MLSVARPVTFRSRHCQRGARRITAPFQLATGHRPLATFLIAAMPRWVAVVNAFVNNAGLN